MKKVITVSVVLFGVAAMSSGAHAAEQQASAERPHARFRKSPFHFFVWDRHRRNRAS